MNFAKYGFLILALACLGCSSGTGNQPRLDTSSVTALLDLLDTIAAHNPDAPEAIAHLATADQATGTRWLDSLVDRNRQDPGIRQAIDRMIASPGYRLYYTHFKNVTPGVHREILLHLPYEAINSPAGIADVLRELYGHRDQVRAWVGSAVDRVDFARSEEIARGWVPPGNHEIPQTRFFYDGNGDAFAGEDAVGFDLYGVLLSQLPGDQRFEMLSTLGTERIEEVLAHEYQHIFADDILYSAPDESCPQARGIRRVTRLLVSEGLAGQCDPRRGMEKEIVEDTAVITYWIDNLKKHAAIIADGSTPQNQLSIWLDSCFQALATAQRTSFLNRHFEPAVVDSILRTSAVLRPDLTHTLGRWMVRRIARDGADRAQAVRLLDHPDSLYAWYDQSVPHYPPSLKFDWR